MKISDLVTEESSWLQKAVQTVMYGMGDSFPTYVEYATKYINRYNKNQILRMMKREFKDGKDPDFIRAINTAKENEGHADRISFTESAQMNYDVVEDTIVFMKNDPIFYRKEFYPAMCKIADTVRAGRTIDRNKILTPMIEKGCNGYTNKYHQGKSSEEVFTAQDRSELLQSIYSECMQEINNGEYT